jgi:hypothetical protein
MNAPEPRMDWTDANQRLLVAEFARLRQRLAGADDSVARTEADALRLSMLPMDQPAAIDNLARAFALSPFERDTVLLAAGVEMDSQLAALCGEASGQPLRPWATFGLALAVLAESHWSALAPVAPLRHWRLIEVDEGASLASARLRIDERVLHFLAGVDYVDLRLAPLLRAVPPVGAMATSHQAVTDAVLAGLAAVQAPAPWPLVQLCGDDAPAREDVAALVAARMGCRLLALAPEALPSSAPDVSLLATLWQREAALSPNALFIACDFDSASSGFSPALRQFIERSGGLVFLGCDQAISDLPGAGFPHIHHLTHRVMRPTAAEQYSLWRDALGPALAGHEAELNATVAQFRWSARRIADTAAQLQAQPLAAGDLWRAGRQASPARLADLAQPVPVRAEWDDLVLPEVQKQTLAQILVHMRHRFAIYGEWGFAGKGALGLGIAALFAGESGTGKTMAAEVLAQKLQLDLYRIDLSSVVSKYIGETEKSLRRVFDAAEDSGAILLFDEADALFGKRSEVRDSHDRYANIEVSYLLQRMEAYRGLAILTTNHRAALDPAFMRRLRFLVQFPFPEPAEREAIWRRVFPAATPTCGLDFGKLARLQAAGGQIRNIALAAAFFAADAGEPVGMAHVLRAARAESVKRERPMSETETRGWL